MEESTSADVTASTSMDVKTGINDSAGVICGTGCDFLSCCNMSMATGTGTSANEKADVRDCDCACEC